MDITDECPMSAFLQLLGFRISNTPTWRACLHAVWCICRAGAGCPRAPLRLGPRACFSSPSAPHRLRYVTRICGVRAAVLHRRSPWNWYHAGTVVLQVRAAHPRHVSWPSIRKYLRVGYRKVKSCIRFACPSHVCASCIRIADPSFHMQVAALAYPSLETFTRVRMLRLFHLASMFQARSSALFLWLSRPLSL